MEKVVKRHAQHVLSKKRILYVVSNPATLLGFPVGFFAEELTRPFFDFIQKGYEVDIVPLFGVGFTYVATLSKLRFAYLAEKPAPCNTEP